MASLRVRWQDGGYVQTVKAGIGMDRGEWATNVLENRPSRRALRATPAGDVLKRNSHLTAVFSTSIQRRTWIVAGASGAVEVSLDTGEIVSGDRRELVAEAEIE